VSVIDQDPYRLGALAAARIFDRLAGVDGGLEEVTVLDVALVERESCRLPAPAGD
jgi:LacI family transcriptional regulator